MEGKKDKKNFLLSRKIQNKHFISLFFIVKNMGLYALEL
jgi:hypothetical protein